MDIQTTNNSNGNNNCLKAVNPNLFPCPDCGKEISVHAKICPQCGNDLCACKLSYAVPDITKKDAPVKTVHFSVEKTKYTMHVCKVCVCIAEARLPVSRCPERSYL